MSKGVVASRVFSGARGLAAALLICQMLVFLFLAEPGAGASRLQEIDSLADSPLSELGFPYEQLLVTDYGNVLVSANLLIPVSIGPTGKLHQEEAIRLPSRILGLAGGELIYVITETNQLFVVSFSGASLQIVGSTQVPAGEPVRTLLLDKYLYAVSESGGTTVLSIEDPRQPVVLNGELFSDEGIASIDVNRGLVAMSPGSHAGLRLYSVSERDGAATLDLVAETSSIRKVVDIVFGEDGHLYILDQVNGLSVLDTMNASGLRFISRTTIRGDANFDLAVEGGVAAVGSLGAIVFLDLTDRSNPFETAELRYGGSSTIVRNLVLSQEYLFVTSSDRLSIVNVVELSEPVISDTIASFLLGVDVALSDGLVAVAAQTNGVRLLEFFDVRHPREISVIDVSVSAAALAMKGAVLYVLDGILSHSLQVVDASNPAMPSFGARVHLGGMATAIKYADDVLYVAVQPDGDRGSGEQRAPSIYRFDVTNPVEPARLEPLQEVGAHFDVIEGLMIAESAVDVNTISSYVFSGVSGPEKSSAVEVPGKILDVAIEEPFVHVLHVGGVSVFRVDRQGELSSLASVSLAGELDSLSVSAGFAYVTDLSGQILVLDGRSGSEWAEIQRIQRSAESVLADRELVYVVGSPGIGVLHNVDVGPVREPMVLGEQVFFPQVFCGR